MSKREKILRYLLLLLGIFFIGLGIAVAKQSNLGISPVSSLPNVLNIKFPFLTIGNWLTVFNCLLILIQIIILRRGFKPIQLLQFPISLLLGIFTDINVAIVSLLKLSSDTYIENLLFVLVSILIIALGISLTVIANVIMNVGEAFVSVIAKVTNKNFGTIKVLFDVGCVLSAVVLSLLFFDFKIVGVREGTIITAILTGFVVKWFIKTIKNPITKFITSK